MNGDEDANNRRIRREAAALTDSNDKFGLKPQQFPSPFKELFTAWISISSLSSFDSSKCSWFFGQLVDHNRGLTFLIPFDRLLTGVSSHIRLPLLRNVSHLLCPSIKECVVNLDLPLVDIFRYHPLLENSPFTSAASSALGHSGSRL
jgi:hypothetical protein